MSVGGLLCKLPATCFREQQKCSSQGRPSRQVARGQNDDVLQKGPQCTTGPNSRAVMRPESTRRIPIPWLSSWQIIKDYSEPIVDESKLDWSIGNSKLPNKGIMVSLALLSKVKEYYAINKYAHREQSRKLSMCASNSDEVRRIHRRSRKSVGAAEVAKALVGGAFPIPQATRHPRHPTSSWKAPKTNEHAEIQVRPGHVRATSGMLGK